MAGAASRQTGTGGEVHGHIDGPACHATPGALRCHRIKVSFEKFPVTGSVQYQKRLAFLNRIQA